MPAQGYHRTALDGVFEDGVIRVSVRQVTIEEFKPGDFPQMLNSLIKKGYVLINLEMRNYSGERLIYDPVHTSLTDDSMDFRRPLDYTDLYDIIVAEGESGAADPAAGSVEKALSPLKGKFYDLAVTLQPGQRVSRLLIFRPLAEGGEKADLTVRDIYVGTKSVDLSFPFDVKTEGS
jgi:hypothetical protein